MTLRTERAGTRWPVRDSAGYGVIALFLSARVPRCTALFVLIPIVQAAHYSLYKWNGLTPLTDFVGLANYQRALSDPMFQTGRYATTRSSSCCRSPSRSRSRWASR